MVYALMALVELACKLYFISIIIEEKKLLRKDCSEYYHPSHQCDTWALQDLTLSDNLTFQLISSVSQIVLIFFSIQLCYFIRQEHALAAQIRKNHHHHHHHGHFEQQQHSQQHSSARYSSFSESSSFELSYGTFLRMERRKNSAVYLSTPL